MGYYAAAVATEDETGPGWTLLKGGLLVLGGLTAVAIFMSLLKPLFILGVLGGAGYLGYRLLSGGKALGSGKDRKALPSARRGSDDDFDRRMRELDALDRKLDAEIRKHS
jgi:hypothetical protein